MVERRSAATAFDDLERELVRLGRAIVTEPPREDLVEQTLVRIERDLGTPGRALGPRVRRRLVGATAALVLLVIAVVPPVRAAVLDLLRLGAVVVRLEPAPATPTPGTSRAAPSAPASGWTPTGPTSTLTLDEARTAVDFPFTVPTALGAPTTVAVTHGGRVVELTWSSSRAGQAPGTGIRLDILAGSPDWGYLKQVWTELTPTTVGDHDGLWIGAPHQLWWVDRSGVTQLAPARAAGPTLVWVVRTAAGEVTYRLEGATSLGEATRLARSTG
jgi:hypothetical protein